MSKDAKRRKLEHRPDCRLACRGCSANFISLLNLVRDLEQHATADTRWYVFNYGYLTCPHLYHGGVESRFPSRIQDGRANDGEEEGTPVELSDMYCFECGTHAGWLIVSERGDRLGFYAGKCILLSAW